MAVSGLDAAGVSAAAAIMGVGVLAIAWWVILAATADVVRRRLVARKQRKQLAVHMALERTAGSQSLAAAAHRRR